jgi:hypothetical protein
MAGILDSKSRILDTILTLEGKKQLSNGGIGIKYVTFTDNATYYAADLENGASSATNRIYFESSQLPHDQITFLSDDNGKLSSYSKDAVKIIRQGQIINKSNNFNPDTGQVEYSESVSEDKQFYSEVDSLLKSSIDNFSKLRSISTKDFLFEDDEFGVSQNDIKFTINNNFPLKKEFSEIDINHLNEIYNDPRLSNLINFRYLPPVNKIEDRNIDKSNLQQINNFKLGNYSPWGSTEKFDVVSVLKEHAYFASIGNAKSITFDPTSKNNNLFIQCFETSKNTMTKLDIIDFGKWNLTNQQLNELSIFFSREHMPGQTVQILFVGKMLSNDNINSFLHLFTLVFG